MNLSGKLPSGDANGLAALARMLIDHPKQVHVVIGLVDCVKVTQMVDGGDHVPTLRLRRVEVITDADDAGRLRVLMRREFERRTGQTVLPFDLEEDLRSAFGPDTTDPTDPDGKD